jgi:hypothetical protein
MTVEATGGVAKSDEFKSQTPETYKWVIGAGGVITAATTALLAYKPETAGYSLSATILFILLVFIVIGVEKGTSQLDTTNPVAKAAKIQVIFLSWFATISLSLGALAIISSILFTWPLDMSLGENKTTAKYINSIKRFDTENTYFERDGSGGRGWREKLLRYDSLVHSFTETGFNGDFLWLLDKERKVTIRIPTQGGMVQWSLNDQFTQCGNEYCWGDVAKATMRR